MVDGRVHRMTELFGRLAPGVDLEAARAELRTVHGAIVKEHPESYPANADFRIDAVRLRDQIVSPARTVLLVLLAASALVFVIACSNVANLILARSVRREGELAIRAALGAGAGALRRTLLAESLLLCGAGRDPRRRDRAADGRDPGALRGALLGTRARRDRGREPAVGRRRSRGRWRRWSWRSCRGLPSAEASTGFGLSSGSVRITSGTNRRLRLFAVIQIAASFVLLAGAGMLLTTLLALQSAATGFKTQQRARGQRADRLVRSAAGADRVLLPRGAAAHRPAARRRAGRDRHDRAVARRRRLRSRASSSRSRATRSRTAKRIRAAGSAPSRPASSRRSACRSSPAATSATPIAAAASRSSSSARAWRGGCSRPRMR